MSFVRTLATLAAGFAAAKGYDKYQKMGGMAGLQDAMKDNPALAGMQAQMGQMMEKFGMPGGAEGLDAMMKQWTGGGAGGGDSAMMGLSGLISALGGAGATGAEQAGQMMDALTGNTATSTAMEDNAKLMIRAMIQAARADGEIDADERAKLMEHLGDIDAEERAFIEAELAAPVDPMRLAADTGDQAKAQVYAMAVSAVRVDTAGEADYLNTLATALGLSDETRARVHRSMGL